MSAHKNTYVYRRKLNKGGPNSRYGISFVEFMPSFRVPKTRVILICGIKNNGQYVLRKMCLHFE